MEQSYSYIIEHSALLLIVSLLLQAYSSQCCLENEKEALIQLKSYFISLSNDTTREHVSDELSSWDSNGEGSCCLWYGVACNNSTQHVTQLSLSEIMGDDYMATRGMVLNVTLFETFGELLSLNLSYNGITNLVGNGGNKSLSLRSLEILDFGDNKLRFEDLRDLVGSLTSLKTLKLGWNDMIGNFTGKEVAHLKKLRVLDLSYNHLNGSLPEGLCKLRNLESLSLASNGLNGSIPNCLWNLTSLQFLDLSSNSFSGNLPKFINLPSLQKLLIHNNYFQGRVSLCNLMNHSRIEFLFLSNNKLQVEIDDSSCLRTELVGLGLGKCKLISQSNLFPKVLSNLSNLEVLDLSSNSLTGSFPKLLLQNNPNLRFFTLRNNSLTGSLTFPNYSLPLAGFDVSNNKFNGKIPEHIGMVLSSLRSLNMSLNSFQGHIPASIGDMTGLNMLDLSANILSGEVPQKLLSDCTELEFLSLSKNHLQGEIIPTYMNLSRLAVLYLNDNNFSGTIRESLNISRDELGFFDISNNKATGEVPGWIGDFVELRSMSLAGNDFHGGIPTQLCKLESLVFLDLSKNLLIGEIPSCDRLLQLRFLHMHGNKLTGEIPKGLAKLSSLVTLDLKDNQLSGDIPMWIGQLPNLVVLLLGGNQLKGELPIKLCRLQSINIIDLSNNEISGVIPTCFRSFAFGKPQAGILYTDFISGGFGIPNIDYLTYSTELEVEFKQEEVEFIVKNRYDAYKGEILTIMSLLDLSGNRITGEIPSQLGELGMIQALNLSHNLLSGSIPRSFSMLKNIESLDLSSNNLSGAIPLDLVQLNFLGIFNVSYNNLSGEVPNTGQFASYDERNYLGNPLLCGSQINKSCGIHESELLTQGNPDEGFDTQVFLWSFGASSITVFLAFVAVLAINPHWRRVWFAFIDVKLLWWFNP